MYLVGKRSSQMEPALSDRFAHPTSDESTRAVNRAFMVPKVFATGLATVSYVLATNTIDW